MPLSTATAKYIEQRLGFLIMAGRWGHNTINTAVAGVKVSVQPGAQARSPACPLNRSSAGRLIDPPPAPCVHIRPVS